MKEAEIVFSNILIFDGTGKPPIRADMAVADGRISCLDAPGSLSRTVATDTIKGDNLALAPGFIDAHTHDDRAVIDDEDMLAKLSQGVTTVVTGNCGISLVPVEFSEQPPPPMNLLGDAGAYRFPTMKAYRDHVGRYPTAVNVLALVGHSALRLRVMDGVDRPATPDETATMRNMMRQCMAEGASGFTTGLYYPTNSSARPDEVAEIASAAADAGGIYTTHMRDEGDHIAHSIEESAKTACEAGAPLLISHLKCAGPGNWGRSSEVLDLIADHSTRLNMHCDAYPYTAGSTVLRVDETGENVRIIITWSESYPELGGRDLADIADMWGTSTIEAANRLQPAGAIYFQMSEDDVRRILASRTTIIGSDGLPHDRHPHPRLWGTFPRVLGHYSRDLGLFSLEAAINKMTGMTADVFGLADRGRIRVGHAADLVLFDPLTVIDNATYENPTRISTGIESVWVNGLLAYSHGSAMRAGSGQFLRSTLH